MPNAADDPSTARRYVAAAFQLLAVYMVGVLTLPFAVGGGTAALFGGPEIALIALAVLLGGNATAVFIGGSLTRRGSSATSTPRRRLGWAVAVSSVGSSGLAAGAWVTHDLNITYGDSLVLWSLLAGVPYALAAGVFAPTGIRWPALVLGVALAFGGYHVVTEHRAEAEWAQRLTQLDSARDLVYVTEIRGYRRSSGITGAGSHYDSVAGLGYHGQHDIHLTASHDDLRRSDCGPSPLYVPTPVPEVLSSAAPTPPPSPASSPPPAVITCHQESDSLWYRKGPDAHEYVLMRGTTMLRAGAGTVVDKELLRQAVQNSRLLSDGELDRELRPAKSGSWTR